MDVSRIYRLLRLVTLLQSGRSFTAQELADELQVSRRTVFRDLNALEMARVPYYYDPASRSYRISRHFFLPPVNLTLPESLALLTLAGRLENAQDVPLLSTAARAAAKIESVLPDSVRDHAGDLVRQMSIRLGPVADHSNAHDWFEPISQAVASRQVCRMRYKSFYEGGPLDCEIHPLSLRFIQRAWYVFAWCTREKALRTYKLMRIENLDVTSRRFEPHTDVDVDAHLARAWSMIPEGKTCTVHLRFAPKVAGNVAEVQWHHTQQVEWNDDGTLDFRCTVDGIGEISWWVLGYGDQVRVLKPKALAKRVADAARRIVDQYDGDGAE